MNNQPVIAVLTTLYKGDDAQFADLALESICGQDYPTENIRIYLYVDGPVENAHNALIDKYSAGLHKVIRGEKNMGLTQGLNALLRSVGDEKYLFRMDLDDISLPTRFKRQIEFMESNPDVDLLGCNSCEIDEKGRPLYQRRYPETHDAIVDRLPRCNPMLHPTYCIRASTWKAHPIEYRNLHLNEDLGFLYDVIKGGWRLYNLQEDLFNWRTGQKFFRRRKFKRSLIEFRTYIAGIWSIWGLTPRLLWPFVRFACRLVPSSLAGIVYRSKLRNRLLA